MPDTVRIGLIHALSKPVRAGIDVVAIEWAAFQYKAVPTRFKPGIRGEVEPCNLPQPFLKAVEIVVATDADTLDDFLIEVVEELFAGFPSLIVYV